MRRSRIFMPRKTRFPQPRESLKSVPEPFSTRRARSTGSVATQCQSDLELLALDAADRPCSVDPGVGVKPERAPGNKVRIPDASVWCGDDRETPTVLFEVMSDANAGSRYEVRRADLRSVAGVQEIVELHQHGIAAHLFLRHEAGWLSIEVIGADQTLTLESLGIEIPLADLYANVRFEPTE